MRLADSPRRPNNILAKRALVTAMTISLVFAPNSFAQAVKNEAAPSDQSSIPELRAPAALKLTDDPNYVAPPEPSDLGHPAEPNSGAASTTAQSINLAELRGKVIDGLTNQPLRDARAVLSKVGEEHKRYQTDSTIDGT